MIQQHRGSPPSELELRAEALYNLVDESPSRVEEDARHLAMRAKELSDVAGEAMALRALALAVRVRDAEDAESAAQRGVDIAAEGRLPAMADRLRVTLAGVQLYSGQMDTAATTLAEVVERGFDPASSEAVAQQGLLALERGRLEDAIQLSSSAIDRLPGSSIWRAHAFTNRGLAHAYSGELDLAEADLVAAQTIYHGLGCRLAEAESLQNLGWVMDHRGDHVGALRAFSTAEPILAEWSASRANLLRDRATTLLAVGLSDDAAADAAEAVAEFDRNGLHTHRAECLRILAVALEQGGRFEQAVGVARESQRLFEIQGRSIHADNAALIALRSTTDVCNETIEEAVGLARRLRRHGALNAALDAELTAAALALRGADQDQAGSMLAAAAQAKESPRHSLRLAFFETKAELAMAQGDLGEALNAARHGFKVLQDSQQLLGSTEARVNMAAAAQHLGRVALRAAITKGAGELFNWMEIARAGALRFRPVRPQREDQLVGARALLRSLTNDIEQGQLEGRDVANTVARREQVERQLRLRLLEARGAEKAAVRAGARDVRQHLGDRVLVAYAGIEGRLVAVRVDRRRATLVELGPLDAIWHEVDHLRFGCLRLAGGRMTPRLMELLQAGAGRLDDLVLRPVDHSDRPLVVVPMGRLFTIPWALLPSAAQRPMSLAPSATMWVHARSQEPPGGSRVLATGPGLAHAAAEVAALAGLHPDALVLEGPRAGAAPLLEAVDGADLFHIACHGVFRADNPLFSHLRVADGPLAVHELEGLGRAPATVVLSSCDVGLTQHRPGNEWLGMATALLSLGTRSLVASVMPVPDTRSTVQLMEGMHRALASGMPVAEALFDAARRLPEDDPAALAARAAFVCIGG